MDNYNDSLGYGTHYVTVTLQSGEYKGHIFLEITGNCKGLDVLNVDFNDFDSETKNDCKLKFNEELEYFTVNLHNEKDDVLLIDGDAYDMNTYIVGIEITDYN